MGSKISLKKMVYDALLADISNGRYQANDIITEGELASRFGVSKAPIREALIELCKDQILQNLPRYGYQVRSFSMTEVLDLLELRADIETASLRRAFKKLSPEALEALSDESLYKSDTDLPSDISPNYQRNYAFHLKLCSLGGNQVAYSMLEDLLKRSSRFFAVYYSHAQENSTESNSSYHHQIVEALKAGDIDKACEALVNDIGSVRKNIQELICL